MTNITPKVTEITAKTILTKSGLPGADWVINPYNGCLFSCMYCYAAQIARWTHPDEVWGTYIDVKINAPTLLKAELAKLERKHPTKNFGTIFFSSVTDPYVGSEAKYQLTRNCLNTLADFDYTGEIAIQTKSPLVTKDIDILQKLNNVIVGFTITALDDQIARFLEVHAPPITRRLEALDTLHKAGISTYAFIGPIIPYILNKEIDFNKLLDKLENIGVKEVWFEHINLNTKIKERLYNYLKTENPQLIEEFNKANTEEYRSKLDSFIIKAMHGRSLSMGLGKVIHHKRSTTV